MGRVVSPMTMVPGERVLEAVPLLQRALGGTGPALLPVGDGDPRTIVILDAMRAHEPLTAAEDDPADPTVLVVPTSGSTGTPKGVLLSAGALAASAAATEQRLGGPGQWLLTLPTHHIAGLQVLLRAARAGTVPVVLDTSRSFTGARFAAAAARMTGPRRYVSLVPTQLRRVLADPAATDAAAGFDAVLVGGAACPAPLLTAARGAGLPVVTTYGMTETCGGCVYDGRPLTAVSVNIAADGGITLAGPMVARGYRGRPADPAFPAPGRFLTGDAGRWDENGRLQVVGRRDGMITTGGVTVAPAVVEQALLAVDGIDGAVVVGVADEQWGQAVAAVVTGPVDWDLAALRAALSGLPTSHRPQRMLQVGTIPQVSSGKPDRIAVRDLWGG